MAIDNGKNDMCETFHVHPDKLAHARLHELDDDTSLRLAEVFKVLGDQTRIKLLSLLCREEELCVCDIAEALGMGQSAISHQLRVLRNARLVKFRKDGKEAFYSLDDDHVVKLMMQGLEHVLHG
jgi:DNA-binding transcriptional ArsR family regulator